MGIMEVFYCADGTPVLNVANGGAQVRFRQKQERALDYFSELSRSQGYTTKAEAEYGKGVSKKPMTEYRKPKKSLLEKIIDFFTYDI